MFLDIGLNVTDTLFFQNFINRNQNTGFFHISEAVIDSRTKHTHRRRQAHVGIYQRRNVVAQFADFRIQHLIVFLERIIQKSFSSSEVSVSI